MFRSQLFDFIILYTFQATVLTYLSKIFQKVFYVILNDYFAKSKLLSQRQHGFCNGLSTSLTIIDLYDNLLQNFDNNLHRVRFA